MTNTLSGTGVALVTPFRNNHIDFDSLGALIAHVIEGGVDFIVSLGTTGEAATLTTEECTEVLRFTQEKTAERVPLVAGLFGGNWTERIRHRFTEYDLEGFSAVMSSSPAYLKPSQEGIYQHYMRIGEASPLPLILYNVPGRTASNVTAETTLRLARDCKKIAAIKEASGDLVQAMRLIKHRPKGFRVLSGDDQLTLPMLGAGGDGVISVIANAFPAEFSAMVRSALQGDFGTARRLNNLLLDVHPWLYVDGNPPGIKAALEIMGFCHRDLRLPQVPVSDNTYTALREVLQNVLAARS